MSCKTYGRPRSSTSALSRPARYIENHSSDRCLHWSCSTQAPTVPVTTPRSKCSCNSCASLASQRLPQGTYHCLFWEQWPGIVLVAVSMLQYIFDRLKRGFCTIHEEGIQRKSIARSPNSGLRPLSTIVHAAAILQPLHVAPPFQASIEASEYTSTSNIFLIF